MRKFILLGILIPSCFHLNAQKWHLDLFGGFSNYQGDLQEKRFTTEQAKAAVAVGVRYDLNSRFSLRSNFTYAAISAADRFNRQADLKARNLSFQSKVTELNLLVNYNLMNPDFHSIVPYVFGGIAVFHYNPYAFDSSGNKIYLQPLGTEGQGLPGYNRSPYQLTQLAIPFGGGIRWRLTERVALSYEIGIRKTFTDYLDDVSSTYVDQATLLAARGAKAVEMAYRGGELKTGSGYPADGTIRGGAKRKDWYYFSGVTVSIGLGRIRGFHGTDNGRTDCPRPVN